MRYQAEESIHNFQFWSGAKDTIAELTYDEMDSLEQLIEEIFYGELPTDTQINDFVWFERDVIAEHLGYEDFDALMMTFMTWMKMNKVRQLAIIYRMSMDIVTMDLGLRTYTMV